jgi:hypothetical protein
MKKETVDDCEMEWRDRIPSMLFHALCKRLRLMPVVLRKVAPMCMPLRPEYHFST